MSDRTLKVANLLKELGAKYISGIDNHTSLITVTRADVSPDMRNATLFITVMPDNKEEQALMFIRRNLGDLRDFLKRQMSSKIIPFIEVEIDRGEKHRQRIDELLREK